MKMKIFNIILIFVVLCFNSFALAYNKYEDDYYWVKDGFINFCKCEIPLSIAENHFEEIPYIIVYIKFYEAHLEGELIIASGVIKANLKDKFRTVYVTIGIKKIFDHPKILYFYSKNTDFKMLASQIAKYPYKGRCEWVPSPAFVE